MKLGHSCATGDEKGSDETEGGGGHANRNVATFVILPSADLPRPSLSYLYEVYPSTA